MEVYDLKGIIVEEKKAVIAVALPKLATGNAYTIYQVHYVSGNNILIHFKDFNGDEFKGNIDNFESFIIDLTDPKFNSLDFSKTINVALCHENDNDLQDTPEEIFKAAHRKPSATEKIRGVRLPNTTGTGTIRL